MHRETLAIKLVDLDSCREITPEEVPPSEFAGTMYYACPEVKTGNFFSPVSQDMYAMGILLLSIFFKGKVPDLDLGNSMEVIDSHGVSKVFREHKPEVSTMTVKLIQSLVAKKAQKRPDIVDVVHLLSD